MNRADSARLAAVASLVVVLVGCGEGIPESTDLPRAPRAGQASVDGTMTAALDGKQRTWYITSGDVDGQTTSQSRWESIGTNSIAVTLFGHTSPGSLVGSQEAVMIDFTIWNPDEEPRAAGSDITFVSGSLTKNHNSGAGGTSFVEVTSVAIEAKRLNLVGSFHGTLVFRNWTGGTSPADPGPVSLENGRIDASILRAQ